MNTQQVAFVTYNSVGQHGSYDSGWYENRGRRAFLVQNTRGRRAAAENQFNREAGSQAVAEEVERLWQVLGLVLPILDHLVVYVGASGSEEAIRYASQMPAQKVTFVRCDCGLAGKDALIAEWGMAGSRKVLCECGGCKMMEALLCVFMDTGHLP